MAELGYVLCRHCTELAVSAGSNSPDLPVEFGKGSQAPAAHTSQQLHIKCQATPKLDEVLCQAEANCPCLRCRKKLSPALSQSSRDTVPCLGTKLGMELLALTGLRKGRRIWRRRTWKKLAGVEQFTTIQLHS